MIISKDNLTIIIPHWSTKETDYALKECLTSLEESGFPLENIIVSHNGDVHYLGLTFEFPGIRELFIYEQGQCRAVNAAAGLVMTDFMMVSNNDMIYPEGWFDKLFGLFLDHAEDVVSNEDFFTLSPQLIEPQDGAHTFKKVFFGGVGGDWNKQGFMEYAKTHEGSGLRSGFNLPFVVKKEVWDVIGGYDTKYDPFSSNSDSDLEYKFKLAGVKMYQETNCPVYHFSQTSGTFHPSKQEYWNRNWEYFIKKWGFPRTDNGIWDATFEIPMENLVYHPHFMDFYSREKQSYLV